MKISLDMNKKGQIFAGGNKYGKKSNSEINKKRD